MLLGTRQKRRIRKTWRRRGQENIPEFTLKSRQTASHHKSKAGDDIEVLPILFKMHTVFRRWEKAWLLENEKGKRPLFHTHTQRVTFIHKYSFFSLSHTPSFNTIWSFLLSFLTFFIDKSLLQAVLSLLPFFFTFSLFHHSLFLLPLSEFHYLIFDLLFFISLFLFHIHRERACPNL